MEDYERMGPQVIRVPAAIKRRQQPSSAKAIKAKEDTQLSSLPGIITPPMAGFSSVKYNPKSISFNIPPTTKIAADPPPAVAAVTIVVPEVTDSLDRLLLETGKYPIAKIKEVLHMRGVSIPGGVMRKQDYIDLALRSGVADS